MPSISDIVQVTLGDGLPILLPDTCSLLDIIRSTARKESGPDGPLAALRIADAVRAGKCRVVVPSVVRAEFDTHVEGAVKILESFLIEQQENINKINSLAKVGKLGEVTIPLDRGIIGHMEKEARYLIDSASHIDCTDDMIRNAAGRVFNYTPPSKPGKESFKDSMLFEECIKFARQVRAGGGVMHIAFVTSNSSDFYENKADPRFKVPLKAEGDAVNLELCNSWQHAERFIK